MIRSRDFRRVFRGILLSVLLMAPLSQTVWPQPFDFLIVKYGDESATPEMAEGFLQQMSQFLSQSLPGSAWEGHIANTPELATQLLQEHHPRLAFIPPGFYLQHFLDQPEAAEILVEVPRFGSVTERYYIVARNNLTVGEDWLRGRVVASTFSVDHPYLRRVVFPPDMQPDKHFSLQESDNLADEIFLVLEGGPDSSVDALLLDEELKEFFRRDDLVWPELQIVWSSGELPRDVVVAVGSWDPREKTRLRGSFLEMSKISLGREILELMSSSGMQPVNRALFEKARSAYRSGQ